MRGVGWIIASSLAAGILWCAAVLLLLAAAVGAIVAAVAAVARAL